MIDAALLVGDAQDYLQRWIQPRVNRLAGLSIDARETYQAIYLDDVGDDFRSNTWLREIYDEASVFWRDNPYAVDIAEVADSLAIKFRQIVSRARAGLMPWSTCELTAKKILDSIRCCEGTFPIPHRNPFNNRTIRYAKVDVLAHLEGCMPTSPCEKFAR